MSSRYKVQIFTHSGCMIELEEAFAVFSDAADRAAVIALNGLRVCLNPACMTYIPLPQISSVSIEDTEQLFVPNATIADLAALESNEATEPQSN